MRGGVLSMKLLYVLPGTVDFEVIVSLAGVVHLPSPVQICLHSMIVLQLVS